MTLQQLAAACLADPSGNAAYRVERLDQADRQAGELCWKSLGALPRIERASLLAALGAALTFPDYYGQNWDAAWDCLTELDWPAGQLLVVHLPLDAADAVVEEDLAVFVELLQDACQHWGERGRALCLLIEGPSRGLDCLAQLPQLEQHRTPQ